MSNIQRDHFQMLKESRFGETFDLFCSISDWTIFGILTLVNFFVFYKLRFQIDF